MPGIHGYQKKTLAFFVIGIVLSGSAVLQRVAASLSLQGINPAKMTSIERRLARFLANDRVVVTKIWDDFLSQVLVFWHGKSLRFVLDGTPLRDDATIVYLGLLVHSRVLPVAWAVMPTGCATRCYLAQTGSGPALSHLSRSILEPPQEVVSRLAIVGKCPVEPIGSLLAARCAFRGRSVPKPGEKQP